MIWGKLLGRWKMICTWSGICYRIYTRKPTVGQISIPQDVTSSFGECWSDCCIEYDEMWIHLIKVWPVRVKQMTAFEFVKFGKRDRFNAFLAILKQWIGVFLISYDLRFCYLNRWNVPSLLKRRMNCCPHQNAVHHPQNNLIGVILLKVNYRLMNQNFEH